MTTRYYGWNFNYHVNGYIMADYLGGAGGVDVNEDDETGTRPVDWEPGEPLNYNPDTLEVIGFPDWEITPMVPELEEWEHISPATAQRLLNVYGYGEYAYVQHTREDGTDTVRVAIKTTDRTPLEPEFMYDPESLTAHNPRVI